MYRDLYEQLNNSIDMETLAPSDEVKPDSQGLVDPRRVRDTKEEEYDPTALMREWMKIIKASGSEYRKKSDEERQRAEASLRSVEPSSEGATPKKKSEEATDETKESKESSVLDGTGVESEGGGNFVLPRYTGDNNQYVSLAREAAARNGIPEDLFLKLVKQESGFKPTAVSSAGAIGLAQLMPGTAKYLGVDPTDPVQNLDGGARYLREQYDRFGRWDYALAAYNAGPGAVQKHGGIPPYKETQNYVKSVLG